MTREEAIAYGNRVIKLGLNDETQAFCEMAIKALEQEPKTEWIPVSERLPGFGKAVLVTAEGESYFEEYGAGWDGKVATVAYLTEGGWEMSDLNYNCQINKITAWMPLPPSYQGE